MTRWIPRNCTFQFCGSIARRYYAVGGKQITGCAHHATLLAVVRCAMTLALPHWRQRKRLTNCATGAPGLTPKRGRSPSAMTPRCRHLRQRTAITQLFAFPYARAATAQFLRNSFSIGIERIWALIRGNQPVTQRDASELSMDL